MKQFILIIREDIRTKKTDSELKEIIQLHTQWAKELSQKGIFIDGYGISDNGCLLVSDNNQIQVNPIPQPDIAVGGFYIIQADTLDAAIEIAKACPTFSIGDKIEVRELI